MFTSGNERKYYVHYRKSKERTRHMLGNLKTDYVHVRKIFNRKTMYVLGILRKDYTCLR